MTTAASRPARFEVLTKGRVGVDIYPEQVGVPLEEVTVFAKFLGGSPTDVAVAAARHGRSTAVITRTGTDPFVRFVHKALRGFGVDDRYVTEVEHLPTPVTSSAAAMASRSRSSVSIPLGRAPDGYVAARVGIRPPATGPANPSSRGPDPVFTSRISAPYDLVTSSTSR
jgi:hypothetical protein